MNKLIIIDGDIPSINIKIYNDNSKAFTINISNGIRVVQENNKVNKKYNIIFF